MIELKRHKKQKRNPCVLAIRTTSCMKKAIFWHRRDLRIQDNAGLYKALKSGTNVQPIFIFDTSILQHLPHTDQRIIFIHHYVSKLKHAYAEFGADLKVFFGTPFDIFSNLISQGDVVAVYSNRDYEPYALKRDQQIFELLTPHNIPFIGAKDHVIFEKNEVLKEDGKPYTVYTPYSNKWKSKLSAFFLKPYPTLAYVDRLVQAELSTIPSLKDIGFSELGTEFPKESVSDSLILNYHYNRDYPAVNGTSRLSVHLRFGTISIRSLSTTALQLNEKFLNELIWRDFYHMIIFHFPNTVNQSFKPQYDFIEWENNEAHFNAWCEGNTGYPLVDAGMRELNQTGFMHNRVRMVVASFLTKHLLIDWRWGEHYFAEKLLDFDLAANVGGWQWAASSGCDAAPYFRVFNPTLQMAKFDPDLNYIKKWVPEFNTPSYVKPLIDHKFARERVLERYKLALQR